MKSQDFSPDMVLVYLGLRKLIAKDINEYYVSVGLLSYSLLDTPVANQLVTTSLINGLKELIKKKIITCVDKDKKKRRTNEYILNLSNFQIDKVKSKQSKEYYTTIGLDKIKKILESDWREKLSLLRFYCYLMTTISKTGDKVGVGFTPYKTMAEYIGITRQTISKYMDTLEINNVISLYRSKDAIVQNGKVKDIPNVYGDILDKKQVIEVGSEYENNYGENAKKIKSSRNSNTRSASAKFSIMKKNLFETGEIKYKYDELKEIYETLVEYNKKYSYDESVQKDLSIFSAYDFYDNAL